MKATHGSVGRPDDNLGQCFLKLPGSDRLRTLPDGLWLNFGGTPAEPYADIFAIEAVPRCRICWTSAPVSPRVRRSLMAVCPLPWLLLPAQRDSELPRWRLTGVLRDEPTAPLVLPVRDVRVMYGLQTATSMGS